jgi:hypothetical protein
MTLRNWRFGSMPQPIDLEIREQLARYLVGETSLAEFQDWFGPVVWGIEQYASPTAQELAYEIEGRLAEAVASGWEEPTLRRILSPLVEQYRVGTEAPVATSSGSAVIAEVIGFPGLAVGRRLEAASE